MINPKYIMFWTMTWALATVVCCIIEGTYLDSQNTLVNTLTGYSILNMNDISLLQYFSLGIGFLTVGIPNLLLWNYSFLYGTEGQIVRWILIAVLDPALVFAIYVLIFNRR